MALDARCGCGGHGGLGLGHICLLSVCSAEVRIQEGRGGGADADSKSSQFESHTEVNHRVALLLSSQDNVSACQLLCRLPGMNAPTYLRIIVNARCTLACPHCHQEGDPYAGGSLPLSDLKALSLAGVAAGMQKIKLLGGEPLLRSDLPVLINTLRAAGPSLDLSVITGGGVSTSAIHAAFDAGLSRMNMSIHGWRAEDFARKSGRGEKLWALRQRNLEALQRLKRPLKLNYVYDGPADDADLAALLDYAAGRPLVVSVLDNLHDPDASHHTVCATLTRLRGLHRTKWVEPDPHSLPTRRLQWRDGVVVEVKDTALGRLAPWTACQTCPVRGRCREGIYAWRLSHTGQLRPCMDRPDLSLDLLTIYRQHGIQTAAAAWRCFGQGLLRRAA